MAPTPPNSAPIPAPAAAPTNMSTNAWLKALKNNGAAALCDEPCQCFLKSAKSTQCVNCLKAMASSLPLRVERDAAEQQGVGVECIDVDCLDALEDIRRRNRHRDVLRRIGLQIEIIRHDGHIPT